MLIAHGPLGICPLEFGYVVGAGMGGYCLWQMRFLVSGWVARLRGRRAK